MKNTAQVDSAEHLASLPEQARTEAEEMLRSPDLLDRTRADLEEIGIAGDLDRALVLYLVATSRLLPKPLSAFGHGPSGSGKTHIVQVVASLIPPERVVDATDISPAALFRAEPGAFANRFVILGERPHHPNSAQDELRRLLREFQSLGRISRSITDREAGIGWVSRQQVVVGPIALVDTTTLALSVIWDEDLNRFIILPMDASPEQTRRIIRRMGADRNTPDQQEMREAIILRHHALQWMLRHREVRIPFSERLADLFAAHRIPVNGGSCCHESRAFGQLLGLIEALALLHQFQRGIEDEPVLAIPEDYEIACRLLAEPMASAAARRLRPETYHFYEWLRGNFKEARQFTTVEVEERKPCGEGRHQPYSRPTISKHLEALQEHGIVDLERKGSGTRPACWKWSDRINLPPLEDGLEVQAEEWQRCQAKYASLIHWLRDDRPLAAAGCIPTSASLKLSVVLGRESSRMGDLDVDVLISGNDGPTTSELLTSLQGFGSSGPA